MLPENLGRVPLYLTDENEDAAIIDNLLEPAAVADVQEDVINPILGPGEAASRRKAIEYIFVSIQGAPPEDQWAESDVINMIISHLCIPYGTREGVKKVCRKILECRQNQITYIGKVTRKRPLLVSNDSDEAKLVYHACETGLSITLITVLVNAFRSAQNPPRRPI